MNLDVTHKGEIFFIFLCAEKGKLEQTQRFGDGNYIIVEICIRLEFQGNCYY